jgi:acyl-coenzyme A synthetase/AMP-(fatty) acid ligase
VPALWKTWHDAGVLSSSARLAISAGAPLPLTVENEVFNRSGIKIHNFYGATECGGIAYDPSDQPRADASFAGAAMSAAKPSMTDDGCLEVRGPSVGMGYWPGEDPRLGRGVFRTSDIAEIDGDRIFLRGRAGELIHVAGQKVSPESIESVLAACDGVEACVVFGVASGDSGRVEEIVAVVAPRDGWTPERIRGFALARLPAWQVPRRWWVSPELKANERGKFPRAEWRRRFLEKS